MLTSSILAVSKTALAGCWIYFVMSPIVWWWYFINNIIHIIIYASQNAIPRTFLNIIDLSRTTWVMKFLKTNPCLICKEGAAPHESWHLDHHLVFCIHTHIYTHVYIKKLLDSICSSQSLGSWNQRTTQAFQFSFLTRSCKGRCHDQNISYDF